MLIELSKYTLIRSNIAELATHIFLGWITVGLMIIIMIWACCESWKYVHCDHSLDNVVCKHRSMMIVVLLPVLIWYPIPEE